MAPLQQEWAGHCAFLFHSSSFHPCAPSSLGCRAKGVRSQPVTPRVPERAVQRAFAAVPVPPPPCCPRPRAGWRSSRPSWSRSHCGRRWRRVKRDSPQPRAWQLLLFHLSCSILFSLATAAAAVCRAVPGRLGGSGERRR